MPTYDYRCEKGHVFELFHGIKDDTPRFCPRCSAPAGRIPSGGAGLLFKGSGFYITDYGKDGKGPRKDAPSESAPKAEKPEATTEASGESKAAKPEKPAKPTKSKGEGKAPK